MFSAEDGKPSKKRSRGGKRDRQSKKDHRKAYKFKGKMGAAGKNLSNKDVLQLIMDVLETNVGPAPAPPESEDEERELLLTSTHHQWLEQVQDALEGWLYYGMKLHILKKALVEKHLLAGWLLGFHASRMECVHSIVCNGLKDGQAMKQNIRGVYHLDKLMRGSFYHRYQLFDDGTAYCIVWHILADPEKTFRIPEKGKPTRSLEKTKDGDQWATEESGVMILGVYMRGYHMSQIKQFCKNPAQSGIQTLVSQWQPELELDVGARAGGRGDSDF